LKTHTSIAFNAFRFVLLCEKNLPVIDESSEKNTRSEWPQILIKKAQKRLTTNPLADLGAATTLFCVATRHIVPN
jgi:hypothetical protein